MLKHVLRAPAPSRFLRSQRTHIDALLKQRGIDAVKFGGDMEFDALEENDHIPQSAQLLEKHEALKEQVLAHVKEHRPDKLEEAKTFNTSECLMYQMIYLEPSTHGFFEPQIGNGDDQESFYDAVGVLEMKFKPATSEELNKHIRDFTKLFKQRALEYGLKRPRSFHLHLNMSFWKDGVNLADPRHPEFPDLTANIMTGIQKACAAGEFLLKLRRSISDSTASLGVDRMSELRITGEGEQGRVELRLRLALEDLKLPLIMESIIKPGIAYGITQKSEATAALRPVIEFHGDRFGYVYNIMEGSTLEPLGNNEYRLLPPARQLTDEESQIYRDVAGEMGWLVFRPVIYSTPSLEAMRNLTAWFIKDMLKTLPETFPEKEKHSLHQNFYAQFKIEGERVTPPSAEVIQQYLSHAQKLYMNSDGMLAFFQDIRIRKDGDRYKIIWPKDRIVEGKEVPYALPEGLESAIECTGIVPAMQHPGYAPSLYRNKAMMDNDVFADTVIPGMRHELTKLERGVLR